MRELRDSLARLGDKAGYDFSYEMERLDEDIAEREEKPESLSEGNGIPGSATLTLHEVVTDDDVRQMFSTLGSE